MTPPLPSPREAPGEGMDVVAAATLLGRAREAQSEWAARTVAERVHVMESLPRLLFDRMDHIADAIVAENGKPRAEALAHEVVPAVALARHHLDSAVATLGEARISSATVPHRKAIRTHQPYGVVVAIAPWNLPFLIPFSQVLPALIAGNAVVLKPSELTPRVAEVLVELISDCGLPTGVLQLAVGDGAVGAELVAARPDKVLFTGSVATGRKVMAAAARFPIPVGLELGGIDAAIVLDDADLEFTTSAVAWGANFNGGQACCSIERVLVHDSLHDAFLVRLEDKLRRIDARRDLAPAIDERQQRVWERHLAGARQDGVQVRGGEPGRGRHLSPAVVSGPGVTATEVWQEETFGPVAVVARFASDDEAVALHNATEYGLTASVFSADAGRARALARRLRAGAVSVNDVAATMYSTPELPWGGVGLSGFGRSHGVDALLDASWVQVVDLPRGPVFGPKRPWWYPYGPELEDAMRALASSAIAPQAAARLRGYGRAGQLLLGMLSRQPKL
ncbi:aldehyde dehydrogenase family protein [Nocardia aurantiaca]|uniref:Aldehyde dehydrogenase family protein n=1 Tax=Nocardia aurantiaca TaxID=2675850 RepID=A0A6I3L839_9NOCA|nr:aldehyde dehydrogenase family protein [Nocardia aurantiaca]MTE16894.1 aldehyde dehydrogenase family protein [Nocardia aurantiaca]